MVILTLVRSDDVMSKLEHFREQMAALNGREQNMLSCLEGDVVIAHAAVKPLHGIFPRRGHIPFVILREDVVYTKAFSRANLRQSRLTIGREEEVTLENIRKLISLAQFKTGTRLTDLKAIEPCPSQGVDTRYFIYDAALEAQ